MIGRGLSRGEPCRGGRHEARELAHGVIGSARVTAFGVSNVAPAGAVVGGLVIVVSYAGFAAPLVVLIALVASLCCACFPSGESFTCAAGRSWTCCPSQLSDGSALGSSPLPSSGPGGRQASRCWARFIPANDD